MIAHIYQYFGLVGILSILAWISALILFLIFCRSRARTRFWLVALAVALAGFFLAKLNSKAVSAIQEDPAEEAQRLRQEQQQAAPEESGPQKPQLRFAEDAPTDRLDLAGRKDNADPYNYRNQGKQTRNRPTNSTPTMVAAGAKPTVEADHTRRMKQADIIAANQSDHINLVLARLTLWFAFALVIYDYFSRINKTCDHLVPLPLAGRWVDSIYPKSHSVLIANRNDDAIRRYLKNTVRRGENFIYYGPTDPLPTDELPRLKIGKWTVCRVKKIVSTADRQPVDTEFLHESAWFGRYCFVVVGERNAQHFLPELYSFLEARHVTRASAWKTVHIVLNCETQLPEEDFKMFAYLCREANFKIVVFSDKTGAATPAYEEVIA